MGSILRTIAFAVLGIGLSSCMVLPGPQKQISIENRRPMTPTSTTVFTLEPEGDEKPLEELNATLEHWLHVAPDGEPRYRGILRLEPEDLYERVRTAITEGADRITLESYKFDATGRDQLTLVDYVGPDGKRIGYDAYRYRQLARPSAPESQTFYGYDDMAWWEYPQLLLDVPIYGIIGLKEFVLELVKSPMSAFDTAFIGGLASDHSPVSPTTLERFGGAIGQDWRDGWTALGWRFRFRERHTPVDLVLDLFSAVPVVGGLFAPRMPPVDADPLSSLSRTRDTKLFISRGIHGGGRHRQHFDVFADWLRDEQIAARVAVIPYRYGGMFDTIWSALNLSSGMGYDEARQIIDLHGVRRGDHISLVGFSGGVERSIGATRALHRAGVSVDQVVGIAGPFVGPSCAERSTVFLGDDPIGDPVLITAWLFRGLFFWMPSNATIEVVEGAGKHHTPGIPHGADRKPATGYLYPLAQTLRERSWRPRKERGPTERVEPLRIPKTND
ncbi:MAG: hypothetical protein AAF517_06250 [Planctomycetota bacterium]